MLQRTLSAVFASLAFAGCTTMAPPQSLPRQMTPEEMDRISSRNAASNIMQIGQSIGNDQLFVGGLSTLRRIDKNLDDDLTDSVNLSQPTQSQCVVQSWKKVDGKIIVPLTTCTRPKVLEAPAQAASAPAPK